MYHRTTDSAAGLQLNGKALGRPHPLTFHDRSKVRTRQDENTSIRERAS
jgi:hypothetical protein